MRHGFHNGVLGVAGVVGVLVITGAPACAGRGRHDSSSERGRVAIAHRGCGVCHAISGIPGAAGQLGPPLDGISKREILAGRLTTSRDNMVRWIMNPAAVEPGVAMPPLVNGDTNLARDIVAYLYTLK
jgi:cytochrome c